MNTPDSSIHECLSAFDDWYETTSAHGEIVMLKRAELRDVMRIGFVAGFQSGALHGSSAMYEAAKELLKS